MDLQRVFLFLIFVFSLVLVWDGWQRYQHPEHAVQESAQANKDLSKSQTSLPSNTGLPAANANLVSTLPAIDVASGHAAIAQQTVQRAPGKIIHVKTDFLEAEISTIGGDITRLDFLKQPDSLDKNKPLVLFHRGEGTHNYVAQSGLLGANLPNHNSTFVSVSYTHLRAHETRHDLVCRLLLEK